MFKNLQMQKKELQDGTKADSEQMPIIIPSSPNAAKPNVVRRFFFVCTGGKLFNGMMSFNTFDLKTDDGKYSTVKDCVGSSIQKHIGQTGIMLLSISEIPANDWEHFVSAQ